MNTSTTALAAIISLLALGPIAHADPAPARSKKSAPNLTAAVAKAQRFLT